MRVTGRLAFWSAERSGDGSYTRLANASLRRDQRNLALGATHRDYASSMFTIDAAEAEAMRRSCGETGESADAVELGRDISFVINPLLARYRLQVATGQRPSPNFVLGQQ